MDKRKDNSLTIFSMACFMILFLVGAIILAQSPDPWAQTSAKVCGVAMFYFAIVFTREIIKDHENKE